MSFASPLWSFYIIVLRNRFSYESPPWVFLPDSSFWIFSVRILAVVPKFDLMLVKRLFCSESCKKIWLAWMADVHELTSISSAVPRQDGSALTPTLWACGAAGQVCWKPKKLIFSFCISLLWLFAIRVRAHSETYALSAGDGSSYAD